MSTMLFSEEEPIIAHKLALMEKTISELLSGQKTLFSLVEERMVPAPTRAATPAATGSGPSLSGQALNFAGAVSRSTPGKVASRNYLGQPRAKRINSLVIDDDATIVDSNDDAWEVSAEQKRREKLRKRMEERRVQDDQTRTGQEGRKKSKFVVGTGAKLTSKDEDCPGQAAPKHVFVARTAMSTTKETVEGCLEYLAGIKGVATCCTPPERLESGEAFSLSWRVQVENSDFEKALEPSSWKSGWAVKPYFFRRKRAENQSDGPRFLPQQSQSGPLRQNIHP